MADKIVDIPGVGVVAFPDTMSEAEINTQAAKLHAQAAPPPGWLTPNPQGDVLLEHLKAFGRLIQGGAQAVTDHPVQAGAIGLGTVASLASGGLGAVPAMGLVGLTSAGGAGLGLTADQLAHRNTQPAPTVKGNLQTMAAQGVAGAAGEGAGRLMVAGADKSATWLMNRALNPSDRLAREFPNLSQTMIDRALTVSQGGLDKARELLTAAKNTATGTLRAADAAGATVPITAATAGLNTTLDTAANSSDPLGALTALIAQERKITSGRSATLTLEEADALKRSLQLEAKQLYAASRAPNGRTAQTVAAQAKADMAASLNHVIDLITTQAGAPGYQAANADAQQLIGAARGIKQAIRPGTNLYQAMVRPGVGAMVGGGAGYTEGHPILGAMAGAAATSPGTMSREALILAHPAFQAALQQLPRSLAASLVSLLTSEQSPAPAGTPGAP